MNSTKVIAWGAAVNSAIDSVPGHYISGVNAIFKRDASGIGTTTPVVHVSKYNTGGGTTERMISFNLDNVTVTGINTTATAASFTPTSDYRLKSEIEDFNFSSEIIKRLRLRSYIHQYSGQREVGFVAHEMAEASPYFVQGEKDGVDENGDPIYQTIGYELLMPYVAGALKEALLEIEGLKEQLAELQAR